MLASITPLGERGRQSRWWVTVAFFAAGATLAGTLAGAAIGWLGAMLLHDHLGERARLSILGVGLLVALVLDLRPAGVPGPRRQVNERWLDEFRGWVYGLGFGAQLGLGVTTVITSACTYAAALAALLTATAGGGALILGLFGLLRGLTPLAAAGVRTPERLVALHRGLERSRVPARWAAPALTAALVVFCVGALT